MQNNPANAIKDTMWIVPLVALITSAEMRWTR